jgi:hypothetical protein
VETSSAAGASAIAQNDVMDGQNFAISKKRNLGFGLQTKIMTNELILSQALINRANLCSLSIVRCKTKYSLNPATMAWVYEFIPLTGYGVPFPFLFTQYQILTIMDDDSRFSKYSQNLAIGKEKNWGLVFKRKS